MRIGLFTDCYFPNIDGAEMVVHNMAKTFCRMGHEVIVMAPKSRGLPGWCLPYSLRTYRSLPNKLELKDLAEMAVFLHFQNRSGLM